MAETRFGIRVVLLGVAAVFAGLVTISVEAVEHARFVTSVDAATKLNSAPITDRSTVSIRIDGTGIRVTSALDKILPNGVDVDALSILDDGRVVFSTDVSFRVGGVEADDEDLVLNDRGVLSVVFAGSAAGLPASADIDAVHVVSLAPLEILYSLDSPAEVDGVVFADDDIIRFDGANQTVARSGASLIGDETARADVDALWYDPNRNEYILSLDVAIAAATGRTTADAGDLVLWANGALLMYYDASEAGLSLPGLDLDAVSFEFAFFADDFETGNTTMWSNTTP